MSDGGSGAERPASPGVDRTLTVLEQLVTADEDLTLTALAKVTRIPLATCASIVYTLEHRGYATRRVVGRSHFWRPTLRLYSLASQLVRKVDLSQIATAEMRALAEELGMPVHIGVLDGASVVYVAKAATPGFIQFDTYPGKVAPFDLTALGRAIAAHLPADELAVLLPRLAAGQGPRPGVRLEGVHGTAGEGARRRLRHRGGRGTGRDLLPGRAVLRRRGPDHRGGRGDRFRP